MQYKTYDNVIVSPKDKIEFIETLLIKNNSIEVDN
ncbi:hypothetical protein [Phocicoccus schoeneichii]